MTVKRWRFLGLIVLLSLFFLQAVAASPHNSITFDEPFHITLGYFYLKTGDLSFHRSQSPPLLESIISLPLLFRSDLTLPTDHPSYTLWKDMYLFSDYFLWHANSDAQGIVHSGRLVVAGFGVLLGLLLFVWGQELYGEKAGWLAAFLLAFDPNLIANVLATLDLGLTFFTVFAIWRLWHVLERPRWLNVLLAGLGLGLALNTKFIAVALLPSFGLILLVYPPTGSVALKTVLIRRAVAFIVILAIAGLVTWANYGFQFGQVEGTSLSVPAPLYFESFVGMFLKSSEGRANFLDGQLSMTGWPHYFVVTLLLKTPLPILIVTLAALLRWPWRREWRQSSLLVIPAASFFAAASVSKLQIGYRYILPALPYLFLIAARAIVLAGPRWVKGALIVLAAWLVVGTVSIFPHYLSYFNELAGGPAAGYQHLVDSNLDWGQDLPALKKWIDAHRPDNLHLGFFGAAYPDRYGVQATMIPSYWLNMDGNEVKGFASYSLEPGQYAISATLLRIGLVFRQFNIYQAFQAMTPVDRAGYSILIYDVSYPPDAAVDRAVMVGPLASDVPPNTLGARPGHPLRAKWCAWPDCFILTPHPARYIVRDWIPFAPDLAVLARAQAIPIETLRIDTDPKYQVASLDATAIIENKLASLRAAPVAAPDETALALPIAFESGLSLAGYDVHGDHIAPGQSLEVITYWRVDSRAKPPMAIFVHLLDAQGKIRGQHDGLGAALTMLEPGDLVMQRHTIVIDASAPPGTYRLQVGMYNPDTLVRFQARPQGLPPVDRLLLSALEVKAP